MFFHILCRIALVLVWFGFYMSKARVFERCEFGYEILDHNISARNWSTEIPYWLCIAHQTTGYDTSFYEDCGDNVGEYGIFLINSRWCDNVLPGCGVNCSDLLTDDITESVKCASFIFESEEPHTWCHWKIFQEICSKIDSTAITNYTDGCSRELKFISFPGEEEVTIQLREGESYFFNCSVIGYPRPWLNWTWDEKDDNHIIDSYEPEPLDIEYVAYLNFTTVLKSDAKTFTCTAENGKERVEQRLIVEVIPIEFTTSESTTESEPEFSSEFTTSESTTESEPEFSSEFTTSESTTESEPEFSSEFTTSESTTESEPEFSSEFTTSESTTESEPEFSSEYTTSESTTESEPEFSSEFTTSESTTESEPEFSSELNSPSTGESTTVPTSDITNELTTEPSTNPSSTVEITIEPTFSSSESSTGLETELSSDLTSTEGTTDYGTETSDTTTEKNTRTPTADFETTTESFRSESTTESNTELSSPVTSASTEEITSVITTDQASELTTESGTTTPNMETTPAMTTICTSWSTLPTFSTTSSMRTTPILSSPTPTNSTTNRPVSTDITTLNPIIPTPPPGEPKIWEPCELAKKLTYLLNDSYNWNDRLNDWLCLSETTTGFNGSHVELDQAMVHYGIFKISNNWCHDDYSGENHCNISCKDLFDQNLVPNVHCSQLIYNKRGFGEWHEYETACHNQTDYVKNCSVPPKFAGDLKVYNTFVESSSGNISCSASGYPPPGINWDIETNNYANSSDGRLHFSHVVVEGSDGIWTVQSTITFEPVLKDDKRKYDCTASNLAGIISTSIYLDVLQVPNGDAPWKLTLIIGGSIFLSLLVLIAVSVAYAIYRMQKKRSQNLRKIYQHFKYGNQSTDYAHSNPSQLDDYFECIPDAEYEAYQKALDLPFSKALEILPHRLELRDSVVLGRGAFGVVFRGVLDEKTIVAVKTVHENSDESKLAALLSEVKLMCYVGQHRNIVRLLGVQVLDLRKGIVFVAMEFCSRGSLEHVLQAKRQELARVPKYMNPAYSVPGYLSNTPMPFSTYQLLTFCHEVSRGMEFLADKRIIHGDLAARNILLDEHFVAKISDFGLSRQIYDTYKKYVYVSKETQIPWRWLAIETLRHLKFSSESDIWAFGVFMWEVFSLADLPYSAGITWGPHFVTFLERGFRLEIPEYATQEIYELMRKCWDVEPSNRIKFQELSIKLLCFIEAEYRKIK